jgi:hypothetical protein
MPRNALDVTSASLFGPFAFPKIASARYDAKEIRQAHCRADASKGYGLAD